MGRSMAGGGSRETFTQILEDVKTPGIADPQLTDLNEAGIKVGETLDPLGKKLLQSPIKRQAQVALSSP